MLDLREHRKRPDRIADVLPWGAMVAEDVVLNKDGAFQMTLEYRGPDLDSSTEEELVASAEIVNGVLRRLGKGWAIFAEARRSARDSYPEGKFPDEVSQLIDDRRRERFCREMHFESRYYLTLCYLPETEKRTRITGMFLSGGEGVSYFRYLQNFREEVYRVLGLLERIFPYAEVMRDEEVLEYLHSTVSTKVHKVAVPENGMYLDGVLADTALLGGFYPMLGDEFLGVIGIGGFPGMTQPGILDQLNRLGMEYRWCTRFIALDKGEAKREIEAYQRKWWAKRKGVSALVRELLTNEESALNDSEALLNASDAESALGEVDRVSYGYLTTAVVVRATCPEELRERIGLIEKVINSAGFVTRQETINAVDAWLGTIPGNSRNNVRRPLVHTKNLAHLLPGVSAVWSGQVVNKHFDGGPLILTKTAGATAFSFSTHYGDVGHGLVMGPTGSGKSTLLNLMAAQFLRYESAQVFIFDKGFSAHTLTTAVGGEYYELGSDAKLSFQPLKNVDEESERAWAQDWLLAIAEGEQVQITPQKKASMWEALSSLAATPKRQRTIHSLMVYLQDVELRAALKSYASGGIYGKVLDCQKEQLGNHQWQCFEMTQIMETPALVAPVLTYLFHRLEKQFDGSPTLLILDEAWIFLDHPIFSQRIREWLKTLRKLNVSVIFATQSLVDIEGSSIAPTLKEACFTKIYLPNPAALQPDASRFYQGFGLNRRQIEILAYSIPKQDYYYTSPLGNRLFNLELDSLQLAYCGASSVEVRAMVKKLSADPENFNRRYLEMCGFDEVAL